jgi:hypothetical protein
MFLPLAEMVCLLYLVSYFVMVNCLHPNSGLVSQIPSQLFVDKESLEKQVSTEFIASSSCSSKTFETSFTLLFHIQQVTIKDTFLHDPYLQSLSKDIQNQLKLLRYGGDLTTSHTIAEISSNTADDNLEVGYIQYHSRWSDDRTQVDVLIQGILLTDTVQSDCHYSKKFREKFIGKSQSVQNEYQSRVGHDYLQLMTFSRDSDEMEAQASHAGLQRNSLNGGNIIFSKFQRKSLDPIPDPTPDSTPVPHETKIFFNVIAVVIIAICFFYEMIHEAIFPKAALVDIQTILTWSGQPEHRFKMTFLVRSTDGNEFWLHYSQVCESAAFLTFCSSNPFLLPLLRTEERWNSFASKIDREEITAVVPGGECFVDIRTWGGKPSLREDHKDRIGSYVVLCKYAQWEDSSKTRIFLECPLLRTRYLWKNTDILRHGLCTKLTGTMVLVDCDFLLLDPQALPEEGPVCV